MNFIIVALGGALGAIGRYGISLISFELPFPIATFIANFLGSFIIGIAIGVAENKSVSDKLLLFVKTGFCGGFTTFSTFSAESLTLLTSGKYLLGSGYIVLSIICCIAGVAIGKMCI